ncbi:DHH family phosphoesterase [Mycoplasma sp. 1654_15]|uniref:DHH family phosphoesterase n=1 Tax=Mycoplasma sp. 1654_15 TaxID=2725994 RepID=UPI001449FDCC|nr:bifunctional oligoribonuclease/PAP phosphatase NrnA [Mycoplasma sp. 1654_15]QJB70921.1 bifunctional oligoribonuclease/PAP phosphatase NrnA [Mycoplasma sp. 1654_15]
MKLGTYKKIETAIEEHKNIFIFHHTRPDGDCLGSQFGLGLAIRKRFKNKKVFFIGDATGVLEFMDFNFINEDEIKENDFEDSLAIIVDTTGPERVEKNFLLAENKFKCTARIDHHPLDSSFEFDHIWVDSSFSAAAEMIGYFLLKNKWEIDEEIASYVYLGIYTDSNRFFFPSTTARTFEVASFLFHTNFDFNKIHLALSKREENEVAFVAHVLSNYKKEGKVIYFHVTQKIREKFNLTKEQATAVNILSNIGDNRVWIFFVDEEKIIRVRLRSNGPVINTLANKYQGGGHQLAAGANLHHKEQIKELVEEAVKIVEEFETNENR